MKSTIEILCGFGALYSFWNALVPMPVVLKVMMQRIWLFEAGILFLISLCLVIKFL